MFVTLPNARWDSQYENQEFSVSGGITVKNMEHIPPIPSSTSLLS